MRIALEIDDNLFQCAAQLLGTDDHSTVINAALQALVERESARRLVNLGGSNPYIDQVPRRRTSKGLPKA